MNKTPIQQIIEYSVTNGAGYEPGYNSANHSPIMFEEKLSSERVHDSWEGLEAYLFSLAGVRELVRDKKSVGTIYGASNQAIQLYPVTKKDLKHFYRQERKLMTESYLAERGREGGFKKLLLADVAEQLVGFEIQKNSTALLASSWKNR
jgi:hypothetical protein